MYNMDLSLINTWPLNSPFERCPQSVFYWEASGASSRVNDYRVNSNPVFTQEKAVLMLPVLYELMIPADEEYQFYTWYWPDFHSL
jgi:hypothetical protein